MDLVRWRFPDRPHVITRRDRFKEAYFSLYRDLDQLRAEQRRVFRVTGRPCSESELDTMLFELKDNVEEIGDRGGQVVFVRMPSSGIIRDIEENRFPRWKYWDTMSQRMRRACLIHFEDFEEFSILTCPDESHLSYDDAVKFTRALARILSGKSRMISRPKHFMNTAVVNDC